MHERPAIAVQYLDRIKVNISTGPKLLEGDLQGGPASIKVSRFEGGVLHPYIVNVSDAVKSEIEEEPGHFDHPSRDKPECHPDAQTGNA